MPTGVFGAGDKAWADGSVRGLDGGAWAEGPRTEGEGWSTPAMRAETVWLGAAGADVTSVTLVAEEPTPASLQAPAAATPVSLQAPAAAAHASEASSGQGEGQAKDVSVWEVLVWGYPAAPHTSEPKYTSE